MLCGVGGVLCGDVVVFLLTVLAQAGKGVLWGESLTWLLSTVVMFLLFFALGIGLFFWFLYNKTTNGKYMYAFGGNE